jgi:hypothetical protein
MKQQKAGHLREVEESEANLVPFEKWLTVVGDRDDFQTASGADLTLAGAALPGGAGSAETGTLAVDNGDAKQWRCLAHI